MDHKPPRHCHVYFIIYIIQLQHDIKSISQFQCTLCHVLIVINPSNTKALKTKYNCVTWQKQRIILGIIL